MDDKKDFLSSLASELDDKKKGVQHDDLDVYQASSKKGDELRNYKSQEYDFGQAADPVKKAAPLSQTKAVSETIKTAPQPAKTAREQTAQPKPSPKVQVQKTSLSDGREPHSFHEEVLQKIDKKPINIDPKVIVAGVVSAIVIIAALWFFVFAPKIPVPNFVGQTKNDVGAWAKQNGIEIAGIIISEEFSLEYDKDVIISQVKKAGSKIKKDTALTFVASKGADPEETVAFPEIANMTYAEIKDWIETNKLQKTKINTQYNTLIEKDAVINYDLKTGTESNFTRGATLTINVSKGPAPAGTVAVENYVGKTYAELEQWANTKKVLLVKTEAYSDTVEVGKIISQGVKVGESLEEGGNLPVVVSKGKAVKIPNLVGYTKEMLEAWAANAENKVTIVKKARYNAVAEGTVVEQSLKAGTSVDQGSVLELTISIYMPQLETNSRAWYGKDYLELIKWVDDANGKGSTLAAGTWDGEQCSDEFPTEGQITEYRCLNNDGSQIDKGANGCARPLPLNGKIAMKVSSGACTPKATSTPSPSLKSFTYTGAQSFAVFKALCEANKVTLGVVGTIGDNDTFILLSSNGVDLIPVNKVLTEGDSVIAQIATVTP